MWFRHFLGNQVGFTTSISPHSCKLKYVANISVLFTLLNGSLFCFHTPLTRGLVTQAASLIIIHVINFMALQWGEEFGYVYQVSQLCYWTRGCGRNRKSLLYSPTYRSTLLLLLEFILLVQFCKNNEKITHV